MKTYTAQFKEEVLRISDEMGLQKACEKLGIPYGTLSGWRKTISRSRPTREVTKENFILLEEEKRKLEQEVRELRKANTTLKEAMFFFSIQKRGNKGGYFRFYR